MSAFTAALWGGIAAVSLLIGAGLTLRWKLSERLTGAVMGFGAGALISSIAYELVPESRIKGSGSWMIFAFAAGALTFFGADWVIDRMGGAERKSIGKPDNAGSGTAIFLGTLLDGVPESLILGMGLATGGAVRIAFLVAVFVSNVPEGVAGTSALLAAGRSSRKVLAMWTWLLLLSALSSAIGYAFVRSVPAADGRYASAFAGGAVLTMLADVMMPEAFEHGGKIVGLLATLGFLAAAILSVTE